MAVFIRADPAPEDAQRGVSLNNRNHYAERNLMTLTEMLDTGYSVRKIVWSKRGEALTRRVVSRDAPFAVEPRTRITPEDDHAG